MAQDVKINIKAVDKASKVFSDVSSNIQKTQKKVRGSIQKTNQKVNKSMGRMKNLGGSVKNVGGTMSKWATGSLLAVTTGLGAMATNTATTAEELSDMSRITGLSTDQLQVMREAMDAYGVAESSVDKGTKKFNRRLSEQITEGGKVPSMLNEIGVSAKDSEGNLRDQGDIMEETIEKLSSMEDRGRAMEIGTNLFGKNAGQDIVTGIQGADIKMKEFQGTLDDHGKMSKEQIEQAQEFKDGMDDLKDSFGDTMQEIALELIPVLNDELLPIIKDDILPFIKDEMVPTIKDWIESFSELDDGTKKTITIISGIVAVVGPVLVAIGSLISMVTTVLGPILKLGGLLLKTKGIFLIFAKVLGTVVSVLGGPVTIAIGLVIAAGVLLITHWETIKENTKTLFDFIGRKAVEGAEFFIKILDNIFIGSKRIWENVKTSTIDFVSGMWDWVKNAFTTSKDFVVNVVTTLFNGYINIWKRIISGTIDIVKRMLTWVKDAFTRYKDFVVNIVTTLFNGYINIWKKIISRTREIVGDMWSWVVNRFQDAKNRVKNQIYALRNIVLGTWNHIKEKAIGFVSGMWSWVSNKFQEGKDWVLTRIFAIRDQVLGTWNHIKDSAIGSVSGMWSWIIDKFNTAKNNVLDRIFGVRDQVLGTWNHIKTELQNKSGEILDNIKSPFVDAINAVKDLMRDFNPVSTIKGKLDGVATEVENQVRKLPGFALGGTVSGTTVATVGERGREQVILPQGSQVQTASETRRNERDGGGGSRNVTYNFNISRDVDINKIRRVISEEQENQALGLEV